jgi:hypothetical protein
MLPTLPRAPDDPVTKVTTRQGVWLSSFVLSFAGFGDLSHWAVRFLRDDVVFLLGFSILPAENRSN